MLAHRDDVILEHLDCFAGHWVVWERRDGLPRVRITDAASGAMRALEFPEQATSPKYGELVRYAAG